MPILPTDPLPDDAQALVNEIQRLNKKETRAESCQLLSRALKDERYKDHPDFWYLGGVLCMAENAILKAREFFEEVIKVNPNHTHALYHLGITYLNGGERAKAAELFNRVLSINPNQPNALLSMGSLYEKDDPAKAREFYARVLSLPSDVKVGFLTSWLAGAAIRDLDKRKVVTQKPTSKPAQPRGPKWGSGSRVPSIPGATTERMGNGYRVSKENPSGSVRMAEVANINREANDKRSDEKRTNKPEPPPKLNRTKRRSSNGFRWAP